MRRSGWLGHPLLIYDDGERLRALTGTHRLAAAQVVGIEPWTVVVERPWLWRLVCSLTPLQRYEAAAPWAHPLVTEILKAELP